MSHESSANNTSGQVDTVKLFSGGGEMGALMRSYDWYSHPLGDPSKWPTSLKNSIQLILTSAFPMFLWWSKDLYMFHNDPYIPALGDKHPEALGASARVMWAEIWDSLWEQLGGDIDSILKDGKNFYAEDLPLLLKRRGFLEETYWTFSYSPAYNDDGTIGGMICSCYESTKKVLGQRRLKTIKDITESAALSISLKGVGNSICEALKGGAKDIPFALYYSLDEDLTRANLRINTHDLESAYAPAFIDLKSTSDQILWPLHQILKDHKPVIIENFSETYFRFKSVWGDEVKTVAVFPVLRPGQESLHGFLITGISPKLIFDDEYKEYLELLVDQVNLGITNLQLYEKERELLNKSEVERKNLYKVLMQAPIPVSILRGPDHKFELVNTLYQKLFGNRKLDGRPFKEALPELENQGVYQLLDHVYKTGETYIGQELKFDLSTNTGSPLEEIYFTFILEALQDDNNQITGIIILCYDVTPQVNAKRNLSRYNEELSGKNKELIKVNSDLDNFIYTASHDLRAPMSNLEGLFNALLEEIPINKDIENIKILIQKSFERFKSTILDLTEISKAQRGDLEETECVVLSALLEEVKDGINEQVTASNGVIHSHFEVNEIQFSKKNLRSILYNLLSNGIKYSRPGVSPVINLSSVQAGDYIVLSVADNGLGIAPENKDKIFQMFKRLHIHVEGTGVGLYIVKRIMENASGKIEVESEVGKGSVFKLYFPISSE